jgi:hypothetical protein
VSEHWEALALIPDCEKEKSSRERGEWNHLALAGYLKTLIKKKNSFMKM